MLCWYTTYVGFGSTISNQVCTATRLYGTENKFLPRKEGNLWWNQGSKETNARYILCVSFKRDNWFSRFLWYISGTSEHATWVGQTILTCSGTCTPKWRPCRIIMGLQVGNKSAGRSVPLRFFLYPAVKNIPIIFYRGLQVSHTRVQDWKITFFPTWAHNHWKLTFPYRYSVCPR